MASEKAERIVDHFTSDPELKTQILDLIDEVQANPGKHNFDTVIARFTTDPALAAEIKQNFSHMLGGGETRGVASKYLAGENAEAATSGIERHRAKVEEILAS